MSEHQTDITITATNEASGPISQVRGEFTAMARELKSAFAELTAAGNAWRGAIAEVGVSAQTAGAAAEGAFREAGNTAKATGGAFKSLTGTVKEVRGGFNDVVVAVGGGRRALRETGEEASRTGRELEQSAEKGKRGMGALGAAIRAGLEVASHVGPQATKQIAQVAATTVDLGTKAREAGKAGSGGMDTLASGARRAGEAIDSAKGKLDDLRKKAGVALIAAGVSGLYGLSTTIAPAATKETQLSAISALSKKDAAGRPLTREQSDARASEIFGTAQKQSTDSAFALTELVDASRTLTARNIFSKRNLVASDDAAAADPENLKPKDIARALGRLSVGDTGEALERLQDIGISKPELTERGIKFDGGGAVEDKSQAGIARLMDTVVSLIEEKFGGLSKRLATSTFSGAMSNLGDAVDNFKTSIGEAFIPALTFAAKAITSIVGVINSIPEPIKHAIAWFAAVVFALAALGGALLLGAKVIGVLLFVWRNFSMIMTVARLAIIGVNFVLGLFGTSLTAALVPALVTAGIALAALVVAFGLAVYAWNLYANELKKPTETVSDTRSGEQVAQDEKSKAAVLKEVEDSKSTDKVSRYAILRAAQKKLGELGEADAALPITREMNTLRPSLSEEQRLRPTLSGEAAGAVSRISSQAANNKAARNAANPDAAPTAPAAPAAPAIPTVPTVPGASSLPGVPSTGGFEFSDAPTAQTTIESLEDQIRATDDKEAKKALQLQLFYARRAQRHQRQDAAAVKREQAEQKREERKAEALRKKQERQELRDHRLALRETGFASGAQADEFAAQADEQIAGLKSRDEIGDLRGRRELNAQVRAIKAGVKDGTVSASAGSERIDALKSLYEARNRARDADTSAQVAEIEAQKVLAEGAAKASAEEGAQRLATLRTASARAARLREVGRLTSDAEREEAEEARREAEERLRNAEGASRKRNSLAALLAAGRLKGSYDLEGAPRTQGTPQGGRPFGMRGGNYGDNPLPFQGEGSRRALDEARAQAAFGRLGYNVAGENPRERMVRPSYQPPQPRVAPILTGYAEPLPAPSPAPVQLPTFPVLPPLPVFSAPAQVPTAPTRRGNPPVRVPRRVSLFAANDIELSDEGGASDAIERLQEQVRATEDAEQRKALELKLFYTRRVERRRRQSAQVAQREAAEQQRQERAALLLRRQQLPAVREQDPAPSVRPVVRPVPPLHLVPAVPRVAPVRPVAAPRPVALPTVRRTQVLATPPSEMRPMAQAASEPALQPVRPAPTPVPRRARRTPGGSSLPRALPPGGERPGRFEFLSALDAQTTVENLEKQIRATTDAEQRKVLQLQLFYARRAQRHQRLQARVAAREAAEQRRQDRQAQALRLKQQGGGEPLGSAAEADERIEGIRKNSEVEDLRARRQLNAQIRQVRAGVASGALSQGQGAEKIDALKALYEARNRARDADAEAQIAEMEAQRVLAEGAARANVQQGAQRLSTLREAAARAAAIRESSQIKAQPEREEARDAASEAKARLQGLGGALGQPRQRPGAGLPRLGTSPRPEDSETVPSRAPLSAQQLQRTLDAARSALAFRALGSSRAANSGGENPSAGSGGSMRLSFRVIAQEVLTDLLGNQEFLLRVQAGTNGYQQARGGLR